MRTVTYLFGLWVFVFFVNCDTIVYDDSLKAPFADWSWGPIAPNYADTSKKYSGTQSISFHLEGWNALYIAHTAGGWKDFTSLSFYFNPGSATKNIGVRFTTSGGSLIGNSVNLNQFLQAAQTPNTWVKAVVPFNYTGLNIPSGTTLDGFYLQENTGGNQGSANVDEIILVGTLPVQDFNVLVSVNTSAVIRTISADIYGVNHATKAQIQRLGYPVNRKGGNADTRYNWEYDVSNKGSDWFYQNIIGNVADPSKLPNGTSYDIFVKDTLSAASKPIVQLSTIGWTPIGDRARKRWGFSVTKYGAQKETECTATNNAFWCTADSGNGVRPDGTHITGNDPSDTSVSVGPTFATNWIKHLKQVAGTSVNFFALDNEPGLWHETHRDVHPSPLTYDELWNKTRDYATAIRTLYSTAQIMGPVSWGWCEYWYSPADNCRDGPDKLAHSNLPLIEWFMKKLNDHKNATRKVLLNYLDIHYYPQGRGISLSSIEDPATAALRLRSTKSLYDPNYIDESWIAQPINLIPRFKQLIQQRASWLKLAITEYNFGNDDLITGALAQAEVLAIFGREGVDLATRWVVPANNTLAEDAFRMFLNFNGQKTRVVGQSINAMTSNVDMVPSYAVKNTGAKKLYIILFNKSPSNVYNATVSLTGSAVLYSNTGVIYRFSSVARFAKLATNVVVDAQRKFLVSLPAYSASLFVFSLV